MAVTHDLLTSLGGPRGKGRAWSTLWPTLWPKVDARTHRMPCLKGHRRISTVVVSVQKQGLLENLPSAVDNALDGQNDSDSTGSGTNCFCMWPGHDLISLTVSPDTKAL